MTTYDEYLDQVKGLHRVTAKSVLKRLYELLKIEDPLMSNDDMYDRILKDCLEIWQKGTIQDNMPDELKDKERQASGKKGKEKQKEMIVTTNGSVAPENQATLPEPEPNRAQNTPVPERPKPEPKLSAIDTLAAVKAGAEPEREDIFAHNSSLTGLAERIDELELTNGKLQETIEEKNKEIKEIVTALNLANKKDKKIEESAEYQTLKTQLLIAEQERDEYKQVASKNLKEHPEQTFQPATTIATSTTSSIIPNEVEFPAKDLHTFFMDQRYADKIMYIKIEGNQVVGWETDKARLKKREAAKQTGS